MENKEVIKCYKELLNIYNKYSDREWFNDNIFSDIKKSKQEAERHLKIFEWNKTYGLNLKQSTSIDRNYFEVGQYRHFSYFRDAQQEKDKGYGCYISRSDDGRQPNNEWLLVISFSTGAYIFGDDYPDNIFKLFFNELKSYNPKYMDSVNNTLYYGIDSCAKIFNEFDNILQRYKQLNIEDRKVRQIKKLEDELNKLKS